MSLNATSNAALLGVLNSTKNQTGIAPSMLDGSVSFIQALDNAVCEPVSENDLQAQIQSTLPALEAGVLELEAASVMPSSSIDDSEKEMPVGPVADAVWLAAWFQNNAPAPAPAHAPAPAPLIEQATASLTSTAIEQAPAAEIEFVNPIALTPALTPALATALTPALSDAFLPAQNMTPSKVSSILPQAVTSSSLMDPALVETASNPKVSFSVEPRTRIEAPISERPKQSPWVSMDKLFNALTNSAAATQSSIQPSLLLSPTVEFQAVSQPASTVAFILDKKPSKNLGTVSDNLKSTDLIFKAPIDSSGFVKVGLSDGSENMQDFGNETWVLVVQDSVPFSLGQSIGQDFVNLTVSTEAVAPGQRQDAQWTSNLANTVNQWVERSLLLAELTVPDAGQDSLQVRIELNGQEATVYFLTENNQYREAIESQIGNLSDRLADQGLKLAGSFVGQGSAQNSPHQPSAHSVLSRRHEKERASNKALSIEPVLREMKSVHHGQVLDVFA